MNCLELDNRSVLESTRRKGHSIREGYVRDRLCTSNEKTRAGRSKSSTRETSYPRYRYKALLSMENKSRNHTASRAEVFRGKTLTLSPETSLVEARELTTSGSSGRHRHEWIKRGRSENEIRAGGAGRRGGWLAGRERGWGKSLIRHCGNLETSRAAVPT